MYAIVKAGGKQYKVAVGDTLRVEKLTAAVDEAVALDQVLMVVVGEGQAKVGTPFLSGAQVQATVVAHGRGEKIRIFKMKRRKHYQKHQGHRQDYTELRIAQIVGV